MHEQLAELHRAHVRGVLKSNSEACMNGSKLPRMCSYFIRRYDVPVHVMCTNKGEGAVDEVTRNLKRNR